jgi:prolipoprotein diacylglyceryltransferase
VPLGLPAGSLRAQSPTMLIHPQIDPVALQLGPLAIHWYGLTYLAAFGLFMLLANARLRHEPFASVRQPKKKKKKKNPLTVPCCTLR